MKVPKDSSPDVASMRIIRGSPELPRILMWVFKILDAYFFIHSEFDLGLNLRLFETLF